VASQSRRRRGRATEHVVAEYLAEFWKDARVVNSGASGSDVVGLPFDVEVKARAGFNPKAYLDQLKKRTTGGLGFAVLRLNGQGETNPEDYAVVMRLGDLIPILQQQRPNEGIGRCHGCGQWILTNRVCVICQQVSKRGK
jgi:hypothetical protein